MSKWIAEFELEDGDTMPEHMDLNYMGAKIDFHCRPMWIPVSEELPDKEGHYLCSVRYMYPPYNFFEPEKVKYMDDVTIQVFDGEFNIEVKAWMPLPPCYDPQERSDE